MPLVDKDMLSNQEILKCVLGGSVIFEGFKQYADARPYEFHIRIRDASAHKMTAHMIALNKHRDAAKAKKTERANFVSEYSRTPEVLPKFNSMALVAFTVEHDDFDDVTEDELKKGLLRRVGILMHESKHGRTPITDAVGGDITDTNPSEGDDPIDSVLWDDLYDFYGV